MPLNIWTWPLSSTPSHYTGLSVAAPVVVIVVIILFTMHYVHCTLNLHPLAPPPYSFHPLAPPSSPFHPHPSIITFSSPPPRPSIIAFSSPRPRTTDVPCNHCFCPRNPGYTQFSLADTLMYICEANMFAPDVSVRSAREADYDDLIPILKRQGEPVQVGVGRGEECK